MLGLIPGFFELGPGGLALDDQQRLAEIVFDQNVGPSAARAPAQLPFRFKFYVFRLVPLFQQAVNTLKDDKVLIRREVAGLAFVHDQPVRLRVMDGLLGYIDT